MWREALKCRGIECDEESAARGWRSSYRRIARLRAVGSRCRFSTFSDLEGAISALEKFHPLGSIIELSASAPQGEGTACTSRCILMGTEEWSPRQDDEGLEGGSWMVSSQAPFEFDGGHWCATMEVRANANQGGGEQGGGGIERQGGEEGGAEEGNDANMHVEIKRTDDDASSRSGGKRGETTSRDWYHVLRARAFSLSPLEREKAGEVAASGSETAKQRGWGVVEIDGGFESSSVEIGWCPHRVLKSLPVSIRALFELFPSFSPTLPQPSASSVISLCHLSLPHPAPAMASISTMHGSRHPRPYLWISLVITCRRLGGVNVDRSPHPSHITQTAANRRSQIVCSSLTRLQVGRPQSYTDDFLDQHLRDAPDPCFQGVGFVMDLQVKLSHVLCACEFSNAAQNSHMCIGAKFTANRHIMIPFLRIPCFWFHSFLNWRNALKHRGYHRFLWHMEEA